MFTQVQSLSIVFYTFYCSQTDLHVFSNKYKSRTKTYFSHEMYLVTCILKLSIQFTYVVFSTGLGRFACILMGRKLFHASFVSILFVHYIPSRLLCSYLLSARCCSRSMVLILTMCVLSMIGACLFIPSKEDLLSRSKVLFPPG